MQQHCYECHDKNRYTTEGVQMNFLLLIALGCGDEVAEATKHGNKEHAHTTQKDSSKKDSSGKDPTKEVQKDHQHSSDSPSTDPGKISDGAKVFFVSPKDASEVTSPLKVQMGVEGMKVQPAGEIVEGTGHHHIIIDSEPVKKGAVVVGDAQHLHFGKGQTETELELKPGKHTLQLQFANGAHISYGEQLRSQITVTVK